MAQHKLFWCDNCRKFEPVVGPDAELVNRPTGWLRVEVQSRDGRQERHYCLDCGDALRAALADFFGTRPQ